MDRMNEELPPEIAAAWKALDERAAASAAQLDVERVAAGVLERLRREEAAPRFGVRWLTPRVLQVAVVVVVVVAAAVVVALSMGRRPPATALRLPVGIPAMDSLSSTQLESVLQAAGEVEPLADTAASLSQAVDSVAPLSWGVSLDDLSETQLEEVLASINPGEG